MQTPFAVLVHHHEIEYQGTRRYSFIHIADRFVETFKISTVIMFVLVIAGALHVFYFRIVLSILNILHVTTVRGIDLMLYQPI